MIFPSCFQDFCLYLVFSCLIVICLGLDFFLIWIYFEFLESMSLSFTKCGEISAIIASIFFCTRLFSWNSDGINDQQFFDIFHRSLSLLISFSTFPLMFKLDNFYSFLWKVSDSPLSSPFCCWACLVNIFVSVIIFSSLKFSSDSSVYLLFHCWYFKHF